MDPRAVQRRGSIGSDADCEMSELVKELRRKERTSVESRRLERASWNEKALGHGTRVVRHGEWPSLRPRWTRPWKRAHSSIGCERPRRGSTEIESQSVRARAHRTR